MQLEIENGLTLRAYQLLTKASAFRGRPAPVFWLMGVATFFGGAALVLDSLFGGELGSLNLVLCGIILFCDAFFLWMWFLYPRFAYKRHLKSGAIVNHYTFEDETLTIASKSEKISGETTILYTCLYKIVECKEFFFCFLNRGQAFVVSKESLNDEQILQIRTVLYPIFGKKKYRFMK